jgi:hypothetical protein
MASRKKEDRLEKIKRWADLNQRTRTNPAKVGLDDLYWMIEEIERLRKLLDNMQLKLM